MSQGFEGILNETVKEFTLCAKGFMSSLQSPVRLWKTDSMTWDLHLFVGYALSLVLTPSHLLLSTIQFR